MAALVAEAAADQASAPLPSDYRAMTAASKKKKTHDPPVAAADDAHLVVPSQLDPHVHTYMEKAGDLKTILKHLHSHMYHKTKNANIKAGMNRDESNRRARLCARQPRFGLRS